jgi:hypothetical protein
MAQKPLAKGKKQQKQQVPNRHGKKALTKRGEFSFCVAPAQQPQACRVQPPPRLPRLHCLQ